MARIKQTILKLPHTQILCTHNYYLTLYYLLEQKMYSRNYIIFQQTCALICFRPKYPSNRSNEAYHTILWHIDTNIFWNVFFEIKRKVCKMKIQNFISCLIPRFPKYEFLYQKIASYFSIDILVYPIQNRMEK